MWKQQKKDNSIVKLVLWVALATTPMASMVVWAPTLAQSPSPTPSFPLPQTVENGTTVRIDGSSSLTAINQSLKDNFEKQFSGAKVEIAANGTDKALRDLLDGKIDIVAMGRGLTPAEKALGLEQVRLLREKIAIVVGTENPFKQSLTNRQFARIFRGQITNWSQLGGPDAKIRVIDRPETSDTRDTFRDYPAFKNAKFATGANATQVTDDNTAEIVKQLGKDGISYVLANQISKLEGVRVLQLHQTLPDDAKYPFSQPLVYAYKKNPSLGAAGFLGFTLAPAGQQAIEQARVAQAEAIATSISQPAATAAPSGEATPAATPSPSATTSVFGEQPFVAPAEPEKAPIVNRETPFWLLLPLLVTTVGGGLLWWFFGRRRSLPQKTGNSLQPNPDPPNTDDAETALSPDTTLQLPKEQSTPFQIYGQSSDLTENGTQQQTSNGTTPSVAASENNNLGAAALMGGAALATGIGAATWSTFADKENNGTKDTIQENNTENNPPESDEVAWDIEAPAAVVNTSYPQLANIPEETPNEELPLSEVTAPTSELADVPKATSDFEYWDTEVSEEEIQEELKAELEWLESITSTEDIGSLESDEVVTDEVPGLPEDILNLVADAAEPPVDLLDEESALAGAAVAGIGAGAGTVGNVPITTEATSVVYAEPESRIFLTPRTHRLADVSWEISESEKSALRQQGVSQLLVRLYDVTGLDLSYQIPDFVEQYESEELLNKSMEIPASDRDYIAEIGYLAEGDRWFPIAHSAIVRFFNAVEPDPVVEEIVDAQEEINIVLTPRGYTSADICWEITESLKSALRQQGVYQLLVRLYDATGVDLSYQTPQLLQQYDSEELLNKSVEITATDRDYIAEIGYLAEGDRWFSLGRSAIVRVFSPVEPDPVVEETVDAQEEINIVLTPRSYTSADICWEITESQKTALRQQGVYQLLVRLYDATGVDLSYQTPQLLEQYDSEELLNKSVEIPATDRDYIAEIGYLAEGDRWFSLGRSAIVRVFSPVEPDPIIEDLPVVDETTDAGIIEHLPVVDETGDVGIVEPLPVVDETADAEEESNIVLTPRTPKWAYVSWYVSPTQKQALRQQGGSQLAVRVYDVTGIDLSYQTGQLVQQYECEEVASDRFVAIPVSDRDYIAEIGYLADSDRWLSVARSEIVRVFNRPHGDFWFVADAELIIHGATEPNTTVAIGGNAIKIKPDGTFHLRLPFSDGLMDYLITVAADGESPKTIRKKFSQETYESQ